MGEASSIIGFIVIVSLYVVIGVLSAAGSVFISQRIFTPKAEQIFYGIFLIPIAGFYLAFTAYFGIEAAWLLESTAVLAFAAIGLLGIRIPFAIIVGYPLHGLWDVLHELHAHGGFSVFEPGQATAVPLAYGIFCATYDFCMAAYFYTRRSDWETDASQARYIVCYSSSTQFLAPVNRGSSLPLGSKIRNSYTHDSPIALPDSDILDVGRHGRMLSR
ncbi:MAG: DUF6010 family protein [Planctomycetota bacterium]|jgi:hypothetical protein